MLYLHQSNRLENLFDELCFILAEPLSDPLAAERIVVQNQGMARWLSRMIALRTGIAANIQFPLPARFMWEIFASQLDLVDDIHDFDRSVLLWRVLGLLPDMSGEESFRPVSGYLQDNFDGRKAYQLADRISDLFDQYLVYRPDMLLKWEGGSEDGWQAVLWRKLAGEGTMHRARLVQEFRKVCRGGKLNPSNLQGRVCLFGISSIAPVYLELIDGISAVMDIHLMHLSPCRDYWVDITSDREMARKRASWRKRNRVDVSEYYQEGNPLLASLGTVGREFAHQIVELEIHESERYSRSDDGSLLGLLQNDILELSDRTEQDDRHVTIKDDDRSVQFHICHSPFREVEVLHDRLLELFEWYPDLLPGEILVMAPDVETYAPAVSAVFGAAGGERAIPWSLADRSFRDEQPVAKAFLALLDLPANRVTAFEALSLLETPAILSRFNVQEDELDQIRSWVRESGIRWGFDAGHRHQFNLEMSDLHSWSFGLDRLLLGYMCGSGSDLYRGIAPSSSVSGGDAHLLGQLATFIETLQTWHTRLADDRTAAEWGNLLQQLLEDFFAPSGSEADEDFLIFLRETIADLSSQCHQAGYQGIMSRTVVKNWFEQTLSSSSTGQPFLSGWVMFCNMVPMRSVPFKIICLLGMNDTDYPRSQKPIPFDLMADPPWIGDRNRRNDDCYLFLEALLSARDVLYISWSGRDQRDNSVRPSSVVVSGLRDYIRQAFIVHSGSICEKLTVEHSLQPFSRRCFDGSPGTASYAGEWLPTRNQAESMFLAQPLPEPDDDWRKVDITRLIRFWSHPVRFFLQERLGLRLWEENDFLEEKEPFSVDNLQRYLLVQGCVDAQLAGTGQDEHFERILAEGELPHGSFGLNLYSECARVSEKFVTQISPYIAEPVNSVEIDYRLGLFNLTGWLENLYSVGCVSYRASTLNAKDLLSLWIRHLVLNLLDSEVGELKSFHVARDRTVCLRPVEDAAKELQVLLDLYWQGLCEPLHFFPATSFAWIDALRKGKGREGKAAESSWNSSLYYHGEGEDLAYQIALKGRLPLDPGFESLAASVIGPILDHMENVDAEV